MERHVIVEPQCSTKWAVAVSIDRSGRQAEKCRPTGGSIRYMYRIANRRRVLNNRMENDIVTESTSHIEGQNMPSELRERG